MLPSRGSVHGMGRRFVYAIFYALASLSSVTSDSEEDRLK